MTTSRCLTVFLVLMTAASCAAPEESRETPPASNGGGTRQELAEMESDHYVVIRKEDDGVLQVARTGFDRTRCADRMLRSACTITRVDLSRVDMSANDEAFARARIADGSAAVLAKLVSANSLHESVMVVTRIWTRDVAAPTRRGMRLGADPLYALRDARQGCAGSIEECAWLRTEPTNGELPRHYKLLDLKPTGSCLSDQQRGDLQGGRLLAQGAGIGSVFVVASLLSVFPQETATNQVVYPALPGVLEPQ